MYRITFYGKDTCGETWRNPDVIEFENKQDAINRYNEIMEYYKPYNFDNITLEEVHLIQKD